MQKITYLLLIITLFACNTTEKNTNIDNFKVSGVIKNIPANTYISLIHRSPDNVTILDSVVMIDSTFELSANISNKLDFYLLKLNNNNYYLYLLADSSDNISINADFLELQNYSVENSEESKLIQILENKLFETNSLLEKPMELEEYQAITKEQRKFSLDYISKHDSSLTAIIALSQKLITGEIILPIEDYYDTYKDINSKLRKKYLNSEHYLQFAEFIKNYEIILRRNEKIQDTKTKPTELQNFKAKTIDGDDFELNTFEGEWILINFWASWSASSSENNKIIKKIEQEKPEIHIVQISIDKYENIALDSLKQYNFQHILINDTKGWKSELINLYHIDILPTNILINPQGKIVLFSSNSEELYNFRL